MQFLIRVTISVTVFFIFRYTQYSKRNIKLVIFLTITDALIIFNPILFLIDFKINGIIYLILLCLYIIFKHLYFKKKGIDTGGGYIFSEIMIFLSIFAVFNSISVFIYRIIQGY